MQNAARVMLLIIPLDHPIKVKVSSLKNLKKVVDITSAIMLKLNNITDGDRLMLKFSPTNSGECQQKRKIEANVCYAKNHF